MTRFFSVIKRCSMMALVLGGLAACQPLGTNPSQRPTAPPPITEASQASERLATYYASLQRDLLTRGLLRTDGGGPDTPYSPAMLVSNFERIAFYDEYARGGGLRHSSGQVGQLRRWSGPVRINVEFGNSVPVAQQTQDRTTVTTFTNRLAAVTAHNITNAATRPNFHILVMGQDDQAQAVARLQQIVPNANLATVNLFRRVPRDIHCFVVAFSTPDNDHDYRVAVALVRAEHPDLLRKSCFHEEIAQGLGLANDSPKARPSIFNDDDEFALLTTHDESLLAMLYDPRLRIGMTAEQARPVLHLLARERAGRVY